MSELTIWRRLKEYGLTDAGAAGVMGNMRAESGLCAHRLQSDFTQGYTKSLEYTRAVDAGEKNESFVADCKGYGLCQWTSKGRKAGLLQFAQWQNLSIGDEQMQVDYVWKELNGGDYPVLLKTLTTGDSVAKAASDVCTVYERPYICNTVERTKYAHEYYDKYAGSVQDGNDMCNAIEKATSQMEAWALDGAHGYDQTYRWGERGDYDCSAAVIQAWEIAGVPVKTMGATYTGNMLSVFKACGFKDVTASVNLATGAGLARGDVLLNTVHHTAMYIGGGKEVEASINERGTATGGTPGDQTGREFLVRDYRNYPWNYVLRYVGAESDGEDDEVVYVTPSKATTTSATCTLMLPELRQGDVDGKPMGAVWAMQTLLIARHFACGADGADGDFGPATAQAVKNIQTECSLEADAICGALTWKALIGGAA